jgi:hypothetical protein
MSRELPAELLQAFQETHYLVHVEPPFVMKVDQTCPSLKSLMATHNALCATFITASNPFGQQVSEAENAARKEELRVSLKKRSLIFFDGVGQHPDGLWPGEESFLVLGLALEASKTLAKHFDQLAILWSGTESVPQLIRP